MVILANLYGGIQGIEIKFYDGEKVETKQVQKFDDGVNLLIKNDFTIKTEDNDESNFSLWFQK